MTDTLAPEALDRLDELAAAALDMPEESDWPLVEAFDSDGDFYYAIATKPDEMRALVAMARRMPALEAVLNAARDVDRDWTLPLNGPWMICATTYAEHLHAALAALEVPDAD